MVLKFDHISYISSRKNKDKYLKKIETAVFKEEKLKNLRIKNELMHCKQKDHDLFFCEDTLPIEYVFYDSVTGESSVKIEENRIIGTYTDQKLAFDFLEGLFGKKVCIIDDEIHVNMRGILDKEDYWLILKRNSDRIKDTEIFLDSEGYGAVAIIVNSKHTKNPIDGICTQHELLVVNGKNLDICFTKSNSVNIIFEIIMIKR